MEGSSTHPHFATCTECREQFEALASFERHLGGTKYTTAPAPRGAGCPDPAVWHQLAGGFTGTDKTLAYIEHASRCDACGPLLRGVVADLAELNGEITEDELKEIATLESAQEEWQRRLAQRIAGATTPDSQQESVPWWRAWYSVPRLAMVGALLLAVTVGGSWFLTQRREPATASRLLARAYTEKRTLELRIAGAEYAPLRISRGPAASFTSRPPALLKAEALIASQLESKPADPAWLQAKAQADVLEGKYDAAVEALRRALELDPHSPAILTDLATAYFQRAMQEDHKDDLGAAYEYLSQALKLQPDNSVALFNRALVAEHEFLFQQAIDDWQLYLQIDPHSKWAEEAREALDRVRTRLKEHSARQAAPLLTPEEIAAAPANDPRLVAVVDARVEDYLYAAVRSWLPQAFPEQGTAAPAAGRALFFLADLTSRQHNDTWLSDLLAGSSSSSFPRAVAALAKASSANAAGDYSVTHVQAAEAERLFHSSGNQAGTLRARFETIFAAQIERQGEQCLRQASAALIQSERFSYSWLQVQLGLEKSACSYVMGDIGGDEKGTGLAMERAQRSQYWGLFLRGLSFFLEDALATGNSAATTEVGFAGLDRYWSGQIAPMRGYALYVSLVQVAQAAGRPNLQLAIWRQAVALVDLEKDVLLRALAHDELAKAAVATHQPKLAEQEYAEAARLYASSSATSASRNWAIENTINIARLEVSQGKIDHAIARLTEIQDQVRVLSNNYLVQMFYTTLGELQLKRHHQREAEQALRPAVALAEQNLASLGHESRTGWSKSAAPAYLALVEAELLQGRMQEALETYEWFLGAPQRAATPPNLHPVKFGAAVNLPATASPRLPARLPLLTKETVIAYADLPGGLAIWIYDDRGVDGRWIPRSDDGLQELAERFHDLTSDPGSPFSAVGRDARDLYDALISPVEQHLDPQRVLVIEADGWLARVPYAALLDASNHYLIERADIVRSLGRESDEHLRRDESISPDAPALVVASAASSPAHGQIPLPDVVAEAETVAGHFHFAQVLKGEGATESSVRAALPAAEVFHFAGHSLVTADRAGLLLVDPDTSAKNPSVLDATTIRQLDVQGLRLAVLSACATATGSGGSSGFNSITDALLSAGVPHVIASQWAVDSTETRGFMKEFYSGALSGQTISGAVRQASRKMLSDPRTSHPYYWAAFAAYGRP